MNKLPKIAICTIVVNGEDYIGEWIENYLPVADCICIAEGATENWMKAHKWTTPSSNDKTNPIIISKIRADGERKIKVKNAETPYKDKCEQTNAFMALVPDDIDYVLYADSDEFYLHSDIEKLKVILAEQQPLMGFVNMYHFWKGLSYIGTGGDGWAYDTPIPRIFKFEKGCFFTNHRPVTTSLMVDEKYKSLPILKANDHDIICRHYSYVTKKQVHEKMPYYEQTFSRKYMDWVRDVWDKWTPLNRLEIEAKYSIHPTGGGAKTKFIDVEHPMVIVKKFMPEMLWDAPKIIPDSVNIKNDTEVVLPKEVVPIKIGTEYGGNVIPENVLNKDSIVYSFGLGEDASFDIGLIEKYGCKVKIFDPTPRSIIFYERELKKYPQISFMPIGLWDRDCEVKFYEPKDKTHVSHSIQNLQNTQEYFVASVKRLQTIIREQNDTKIDLLKIDIEGAEYGVLTDMILCKIKPMIICVEFHKNENDEIIKALEYFGYSILHNKNNQFAFLNK